MISELAHLARRWWGTVTATGLSPREQLEVEGLLRPAERHLFWGQLPADQRHGLEAARRVPTSHPRHRTLARAALLHDVGKRHARLGVVGRSAASLFRLVGATAPRRRWQMYLDHGVLGAADLAAAGAEPLAVAFARHHHGARPPGGTNAADWELLEAADAE